MFVRIALGGKLSEEETKQRLEEKKGDAAARKQKYRSAIKKVAAKQRQLMDLDMDDRSPMVVQYLYWAQFAFLIAKSEWFNNAVLGVIMLAGVLVGIGTYFEPGEEPLWLEVMDMIIFVIFWLEIFVKVMACGVSPWQFLIGEEYKWNLFDLFIMVMSSLALVGLGVGDVTMLRLIRLMRLAKVFRKIPQLQMIITGLIGGLQSIFYIFLLMTLTFYMYAIVGIIYLGKNDPWHWGSVEMGMMSLFRMATLDGWGDAMFISYKGCRDYTWEVYVNACPDIDDDGCTNDVMKDTASGKFGAGILCTNDPDLLTQWKDMGRPVANPDEMPNQAVTVIFYVSFIILASFCMLSLFVGAVSMSMAESMEKMQEEKAGKRRHKHRAMIELKISEMTIDEELMTRENKHKRDLIEQAFTGQHMHMHTSQAKIDWDNWKSVYKYISDQTQLIVVGSRFNNFVTLVIIIAGVLVGMETEDPSCSTRKVMAGLDEMVFWVFAAEMFLKTVAEEFYPLNPWYSSVAVAPAGTGWNIFDAVVVFGSTLTKITDGGGDPCAEDAGGGSQSLVMMLRLLKLLRVLKLMRALPQLQVIVEALGKGMSSIGFVGLILIIFFYFSGILAMLLFQDNDPYHFGTLHMTVISLFQCATLDDWTPILYINMFGCDVFGYDDYNDSGVDAFVCDPDGPGGQPIYAAVFFVAFILVGGLVLLTLFIGVVSMGMDEAEAEQKEQKKVDARVNKIAEVEGLEPLEVTLYREVFECVDFTHSNRIGKDELRFGMTVANMTLTDEEFDTLFNKVDKDKSEGIDFAEFLEFMFDLKDQLNHWPEERKRKIGRKKRKKKDHFDFLSGKHSSGNKVVPTANDGDEDDESSVGMGSVSTLGGSSRSPRRKSSRKASRKMSSEDDYVMRTNTAASDDKNDMTLVDLDPETAVTKPSSPQLAASPSFDSNDGVTKPRRSSRRSTPDDHLHKHAVELQEHKSMIHELRREIAALHEAMQGQRNFAHQQQQQHVSPITAGHAPPSQLMNSPPAVNMVPSQVVALQQSHVPAVHIEKMERVIEQQAEQMKVMMDMHSTHMNVSQTLIAKMASASSPVTPFAASGMHGMFAQDEFRHSGSPSGMGFGETGGRSLDGRSPPEAKIDSPVVGSRMPSKNTTPNVSPSKKPTVSKVVSI